MNELPLCFFPNTFMFSSQKTFASQRKQTSEVKIFFGVLMALIVISNSKLSPVPSALCVYVNVTYVNFIDQQHSKSFDFTEIVPMA